MQKIIYNYLEFVGERLSKKTYTMYALAMRDFFQVVGGTDTPLTKETYVKFLRRTTTMNPSTQALYRSAIKGLYLFAADDDPGVETAFFEQTNKRLALKPGKRLILFNREGIEKILTYCNTIRNDLAELRDRAFIFLLADSGLRVSEACALRIGYVDLLECQAVVIGKGNKQAVVKFSNRARDALSDYLQAREYTSKAAIEAGVDPATIRVHDFRHYFVTVVLASSGNLKLAQELARHERIETTGRYAHLVDNSSKAYDEIFNKR
jgi:integrase/recombinase XerC